MDLKTVAIVAAFFAAIAYLTSIAVISIGKPGKEAAIAAALRHDLGQVVGEKHMAKVDGEVLEFFLCLASQEPININKIDQNFENTTIKVVPVSTCTSKVEKGNFGMFTAITRYFGPDGREAGHLTVVRALCSTARDCEIDIDAHGAGVRYQVKRDGNGWTVGKSQLRWIV